MDVLIGWLPLAIPWGIAEAALLGGAVLAGRGIMMRKRCLEAAAAGVLIPLLLAAVLVVGGNAVTQEWEAADTAVAQEAIANRAADEAAQRAAEPHEVLDLEGTAALNQRRER